MPCNRMRPKLLNKGGSNLTSNSLNGVKSSMVPSPKNISTSTFKERLSIWNKFVDLYQICKEATPLFEELPNGQVATRNIGGAGTRRAILRRSVKTDELIKSICATLEEDWKSKAHHYDGMLYIIFTKEVSGVVPLYIGKAETFGKSEGNLSANIKGVATDTSKFARWGDNYAYHIGDLSAVVLPGHNPEKKMPKYKKWAGSLFEQFPTDQPRLRQRVFFWARPWSHLDIGVWEEFGPTRLTFQEYLLIGLCSSLFGNRLLNVEGQNR